MGEVWSLHYYGEPFFGLSVVLGPDLVFVQKGYRF